MDKGSKLTEWDSSKGQSFAIEIQDLRLNLKAIRHHICALLSEISSLQQNIEKKEIQLLKYIAQETQIIKVLDDNEL